MLHEYLTPLDRENFVHLRGHISAELHLFLANLTDFISIYISNDDVHCY